MKKLDPKTIDEAGVRDLAAAICIQAAEDYKISLGGRWRLDEHGARQFMLKLRNKWKPANNYGIKTPDVYRQFFESEWFKQLSGITNTELAIEFLRANRHHRCFKKI